MLRRSPSRASSGRPCSSGQRRDPRPRPRASRFITSLPLSEGRSSVEVMTRFVSWSRKRRRGGRRGRKETPCLGHLVEQLGGQRPRLCVETLPDPVARMARVACWCAFTLRSSRVARAHGHGFAMLWLNCRSAERHCRVDVLRPWSALSRHCGTEMWAPTVLCQSRPMSCAPGRST